MAKSREITAPDPVNESETEESETQESDSEPEPEPVKKTPAAAKLQKPLANAAADSSFEEESGSESESDSEPDSPPKKPNTLPEKKPSSSSAASAKKAPAKAAKMPAPASPTTTTGRKRSEVTPSLTQEADTKRSKKMVEKKEAATEGKKEAATEEGKKLFERVFNPEDQIVVLEELLKRYPVTKDSPQMDDVYESIKSKISVPVTKAQVLDKIRRLRIKFFNKKEKSANTKEGKRKKKDSNNVEDELETMVYELSKKIWGNEEGPKSAVNKGSTKIALKFEEAMGKDEEKKDVTYAPNGRSGEKKKDDISYTPNGRSGDEWIFGEGTGLLAEEARVELEKEWKKMRKEEARLSMEKLELTLKHVKMVYDML